MYIVCSLCMHVCMHVCISLFVKLLSTFSDMHVMLFLSRGLIIFFAFLFITILFSYCSLFLGSLFLLLCFVSSSSLVCIVLILSSISFYFALNLSLRVDKSHPGIESDEIARLSRTFT